MNPTKWMLRRRKSGNAHQSVARRIDSPNEKADET
jgi:hypothetical protein